MSDRKTTKSIKPAKRWLCVIAVLLVLPAVGAVWQTVASLAESKALPIVGAAVATNAYAMHYVSKGTGNCAVVFIAGSGTPCACTDFYNLQENLSDKVQTISFDHAGSGFSSKTEKPRTVENLSNELKTLIDCVAPDKPIILVCHSLGSLEAIYYAQQNPEKAAGIVFLDSGDPEFYRADSEMAAKILNRGIAFTRTIGLNRALCALGVPLPLYGESERLKRLPSDIADLDKAMFNKYAGSKDTLQAIEEMNENAEKVINGPRLGELPILVLSSDSGEAWSVVQNTLAGWSENSKQVTLADSSHYLHWSNEDEVTKEISDFIDSIGDLYVLGNS